MDDTAAAAAFRAAHPEGGRALLDAIRQAKADGANAVLLHPDALPALAELPAALAAEKRPKRKPSPAMLAVVGQAIEDATLPRVNVAEEITREAWMLRAVAAFGTDFTTAGIVLPAVRISVGWPGGRGRKEGVVGQCWMGKAVIDGRPAIFVSPQQRQPVEILETILHELVHASGVYGHREAFAKVGALVGLSAPWPTTPSSPELLERLHALAVTLGPLDHSAIRSHDLRGELIGTTTGPSVQSTRMLKLQCVDCGYTVRTTRKWIEVGLPWCAHGAVVSGDRGSLTQMQEVQS